MMSSPAWTQDRAPSRVLIVDDHALARIGLQSLLAQPQDAADVPVEWLEASSLCAAMEILDADHDVTLTLLDLNLQDSKGLHGLGRLLRKYPGLPVAVVNGVDDALLQAHAERLGAIGFLSKAAQAAVTRVRLKELVHRTSNVAGERPSPDRHEAKCRSAPALDLGHSQMAVMDLMLAGCSNHEIARATHLSMGTVKNYASTVLEALDVSSRSHLISLFAS